jgi:hypothetical protein
VDVRHLMDDAVGPATVLAVGVDGRHPALDRASFFTSSSGSYPLVSRIRVPIS